MDFTEHAVLKMKNVLSFRGKMTQQEFMAKSQEMEQILARNHVQKSGAVVTTTYAVEQRLNAVMDIEILVPLSQEITPPDGYVWKPEFLLTNALMVRHMGNPAGLQNTVNALNQYMAEHKLVPITTGYNVTVREAKSQAEMNQMEVDIYVGISPNIL